MDNGWSPSPLTKRGSGGMPIPLKFVKQMNEFHTYKYIPLSNPNCVRVVELFPAHVRDDKVRVLLHETNLTSLSNCEALSYEWGETSRIYPIYEHVRGKILKGTRNLLSALKSLRWSDRSRILWVDALCINQDDLEERSRQVKLMTEIYRGVKGLIVWIGEERDFTGEAVNALTRCSRVFETLDQEVVKFDGTHSYPDIESIDNGQWLVELSKTDAWQGIIDLWYGRTYFNRLWVVQEIALSSHATVVCGSHAIDWTVFANTARLAMAVSVLANTVPKDPLLAHLSVVRLDRKRRSMKVDPEGMDLVPLIAYTSQCNCSNPRDRIFAVLGMATTWTRQMLSHLSYDMTPGKVFQETAEFVIGGGDLSYWFHFNLIPSIHAEPDTPSWVPIPRRRDFNTLRFETSNFIVNMEGKQIFIKGSVLNVKGFILDEVSQASKNFDQENMASIIYHEVVSHLKNTSSVYGSPTGSIEALWQTLSNFHEPEHYEARRNAFKDWLLRILEGPGIWWDLENRESRHIGIHNSSSCEICSNLFDIITLAFPELQDLSQPPTNSSHSQAPSFQSKLNWYSIDNSSPYSRNLFKTTQGFYGVGPAGLAGGDGGLRAVREGDVVAIIPGAWTPVVLRPGKNVNVIKEDLYEYVGPAYIGKLGEMEKMRVGQRELVVLRMR